MFLKELYKSADDARRWLSTLLHHCLCHLFQDQIRQISPALISFLIIQHYSARCVRWSSGRWNRARVCDKAYSHYNTMRILTPKRPLEDRSDRSAMLHCAAPTDTFDPHWATDLTDMARRWPGREMVGHGRRDGEKILTVTNSGLHSHFVCQQPTQKKFQL